MKTDKAEIISQESSRRYEKLFMMLMDAIPSSVLLIDRDMRIVFANRNFLDKSRRSMLNTVGRRLEDVFPDVILNNINIDQRIREVFDKKQPTAGERMIYRVPGLHIRIYYYRVLPFSWRGDIENAILLMDDVTEQVRLGEEVRLIERHLSSVVESASDIVLSTDIEGRILTWNTAAEKISGYTLGEVRGQFFFGYCSQDYQEGVKRAFSSLKIGKNTQMAEWDLVPKQGEPISVSWVCSPMKDDLAQTVGIVAVGRDLTERRKFEMQLLQSQKLAALGVMAGGIAHEIRNPLAICSSASQFLLDGDIDPELRKECAHKINKGIQKASSIIENLLKFARPSEKTDIERVNLFPLLKETMALIANQAKIQKIELKADFPQWSVFVGGVANLLQQVFFNLFLNAINAMPDGGILRVLVNRIGSEVLVSISDTGQGISKPNMSKVFDPFYTTSPVGKGTGLGLSICYSIVKQHFGSIELESEKGKGSVFTVRLPIL